LGTFATDIANGGEPHTRAQAEYVVEVAADVAAGAGW
jgi:hypothetical protein